LVRSGPAGLDRIRASAPDVVLLDMRLPDQSGLEVFRAIRGIDARIPVIFVTLAKTADTAIEAMQQGAFDYLFKPLDLKELKRVLREALEMSGRMHNPAVMAQIPPDPE